MRIIKIDDNIEFFDGIYTVTQAFQYQNALIPKGFYHNGVSCWFTSKNMIYPSMLHDYLLKNNYTRKYCDDMFLKAMKFEKVNLFKRYSLYYIVRGWAKVKGE